MDDNYTITAKSQRNPWTIQLPAPLGRDRKEFKYFKIHRFEYFKMPVHIPGDKTQVPGLLEELYLYEQNNAVVNNYTDNRNQSTLLGIITPKWSFQENWLVYEYCLDFPIEHKMSFHEDEITLSLQRRNGSVLSFIDINTFQEHMNITCSVHHL